MKIDYERNPLAVVKRFTIPYGDNLFLEGRIRGVIEDGYNEVNWFVGEVCYPNSPERNRRREVEIGGQSSNRLYQILKRGSPVLEKVEQTLKNWCTEFGLEISSKSDETVGVTT